MADEIEALKKRVAAFLDGLRKRFQSLLGGVLKQFAAMIKKAAPFLREIVSKGKQLAAVIGSKALSTLIAAVERVLALPKTLGSIAKKVVGTLGKAIKTLLKGPKDMLAFVKNLVRALVVGIASFVSGVLDHVKAGVAMVQVGQLVQKGGAALKLVFSNTKLAKQVVDAGKLLAETLKKAVGAVQKDVKQVLTLPKEVKQAM